MFASGITPETTIYAKFSNPQIATVFQPKSWALMEKVSPCLKKYPKWGPKKGPRGCQRTTFEGPFSITDPGRSSQTSPGLSKTSQAPILELFRCPFHYFVHVPVGQNGTEYKAGLKMPPTNWREFRPCILLFLLTFSPQSAQQDWTCKTKMARVPFCCFS